MRKGNNFYRTQRISPIVFIEKLVQVLWYFLWVVLLIRQKTRFSRQPG
jgi:hypothetical protein